MKLLKLNSNNKLIDKCVTLVLFIYIFLISWTDSFKLNSWCPVYMIPLLVSIILLLIHQSISKKITFSIKAEDSFLIVFLLIISGSAFFSWNSKTLHYLMAYYVVFIGEYFLMKTLLSKYLTKNQLLTINSIAVTFIGLFCCSEFLLELFFKLDIQDFMLRTKEATATVASGRFSRSYGCATEPTVVAFYLNVLGPLGIWHIKKSVHNKRLVAFLILIIIAGGLTTFSSAGYILCVISLLVTSVVICRLKFNRNAVKIVFILIVCLSLVLLFSNDFYEAIEDVVNKICLDSDYGSVAIRTKALSDYWLEFSKNPLLGKGLGYFSSIGQGSPMNWFLLLSSEIGIIGILPLLIFFFIRFARVISLKSGIRFPIFMGIVSGLGYLMLLSTFYNPFLWFLLAIQDSLSLKKNQIEKETEIND